MPQGLAGPVGACSRLVGLWPRAAAQPAPQPPPSSRGMLLSGQVMTAFQFFKRSQNQDFFCIGNHLFITCCDYWRTKYICGPDPAQRQSFFVSLFFKCTIFSIFTKLCKHYHCLIPEHFLHCKRECPNISSPFQFPPRFNPWQQSTFYLYGFAWCEYFILLESYNMWAFVSGLA